jgi:hypothetical protein
LRNFGRDPVPPRRIVLGGRSQYTPLSSQGRGTVLNTGIPD